MKLQEAPNAICKVVKFPASVTSYLRSEDGQNEQYYGLKGGLLKDTQYAWLSWGPNFEVVRTTNGAKVAAWTFGAVLHDSKTGVTCVTELPCSDGSGRVSQFVVGLECELVGGMICVFDIRGSKVLRAVQMPSKVTSVSVVDCGSEGCYPLPQLLSSMTGVLAVGLAGGQIMLVDLCRINCDDGLNMGACGDLRDELHACQLLPISVHETDQETLEYKRAHAARTGDHLCVVLNESFLADKMFLLPLPDGNMFSVLRRRVDVTSVMYIPRIASIVAGFSFGSFQIWNLMQLTLEYMSPTMQDPLPVISFGFQEPCDDPRNFCYLWAVHSSVSHRNRLPFAVMYALCYQSKEWVDGYGYLYQDFVSCVHRFDFDLDGDEGGITVVGGRNVACHTINKLPPAVARRVSPRAELDESVQESDLTLCLFVWETWGANCPGSTHMALFDLNQWYKEQMPRKIVKGQASTYIAVFSLDEVVEASASSANSTNPLLDVKVDPASLSQFTAVQSLEEHFYPSALAFESLSLLGEELVMMSHPGVQRDILLQLELSGPSALMYPTKLFHHCIAIGLKPVYMEVSSTYNCPLTEQREFLLSVALEYQLVGFLSRCAAEWVDGSQSAMGCTLPALLKWGWQRATSLKSHADNLCIPLYDYSGVKLDSNSYQLLDYCGNQLHHLTTLFQGVLKMCKNPTVQGVGDVMQQAQVLELVAVYIEVVEWFVNVGLLPEFPCDNLALVDDGYETAGEFGPHRVPYPAAALAKIYQKRRAELEKLSRSATDKMDILFIDGLVKRECNGDRLSSLWERDGGTGLYPPPSIQSLLRTYLLDGIPMHVKHCIVIYVFLDLAGLLESRRYTATINQFIKFPSAFRLTPSFIKITQALWLLDHQDYTEAIDMLLDPLVSMDDLKPWQHQCIIQAFLYQGQHQMALKYIRVQQPPLKDIEDIRLNLTVLLVNGLIHEAFQYQRQHCNEQNSRDLLQHFFSACQQMNQLSVVLQLALSPVEEEAFTHFLQNCHNPRADDMHVMYYLERSRIAEAMEVNNSIRSSKSHIDSNSLKQGHSEDKSSCVRDTIVQAYANTLPSVTRKLALYCAQEKSCLTNWKQVSRPTPMSVDVHRGELQPVRYRSSLIQATLEKARETWSHVIQPPAPPCTPAKRDWSSMEKPSVEMTPFLCTPRAASETFSFTRDVPAVVFPTLTHPSPKSDDEIMGGSPVKRFRYSDHYPSPLGSAIASSRKRLDRYSNVDALSLLQTPHVRRRTPLSVSRLQEQQDLPASAATIFTPQSILKVRKMVRCSVSPDNLSQMSVPSFTGTSTTPELLEEEEEVAEEKMQDEEVLLGRQIRFSLPLDEQQDEKSTPEDVLLPPILRSASKKSILGVTPRKALSRTRRHGSVRFDNSVPDKKGGSSETLQMTGSKIGLSDMDLTSVVSTLHNRVMKDHKSEPLHAADSSLETCQSSEGTRETSQIKGPDMQDTPKSEVCLLDNESTNMEDDSDVFHSLENSAHTIESVNNLVVDSVDVCSESPLKKQRVGSPDKENEVTSTWVNSSEVKEQVPSQPTTLKTESNLQNSINVQKTRAADAAEARHVVEEEGNNLAAFVQKTHEKNGKPVDTAEVDVRVTEESVTITVAESECKNESQTNTEEVLEEEKKDVPILLDTTTYTGSSFEISEDMEQEEESVTDGVTSSSSDGDISVFSVNEGSDVGPSNIPESEAEKMSTLVTESVVGNTESLASSEEHQKEYQTLQSVIVESEDVFEEKEESGNEIDDDVMYVSDELPDVLLATQNKEHETITESSKEESEPEEDDIVRPKLHAAEIEDDVDVEEEEEVIDDEEEDDDEEEIEDEEEEIEDEDEEEDLDEEKEFEPEVHHPKGTMARKLPSEDEGSIVILDSDTEEEKIEPSKESAVRGKHKAGDFSNTDGSDGEDEEEGFMEEEEEDDYETSSKFDSNEEENEDSEETSSRFDSNEGEEEDNEETMSKFDSGSEIEHVLDEDAVTVEPKVNLKVSTSDDDVIIEEGGSHQKTTQVLAVSVGDVLKDNEPLVKDMVEKEPMDFETCITVNEISKYGQRQISEIMDIDLTCKEDNAGSKIPVMGDHMMDFEVELTASQISKPKQTEDRSDCNTQISVDSQVKLSEMKEENITVPEISEVPVGAGKQGREECDLEVTEKKEQIAMEKKLTQRGRDIHLLHSEGIPKSLQQDGVDALDIPVKENDALPDTAVVSGASNVTAQQVIEVNATRCGIKARKTSESSSPSVEKLQSSSNLEERSQDVKPRKTSSRASSLQREADHINVNTETQMDAHEIRVSKQMDRAGSLQRDIEVINEESYGMKACESSSTAVSTEHHTGAGNKDFQERKLHKPSSTAESVQQEDILSDETESHGRKVCKPRSRASSVQREDVPSDEIDILGRKVRKPSSRASSVQREDVPLDEIESCERKVRKTSSRASSLQCEYVPSDEINIHERKVQKPSSRASSVQHEDVPSDEIETRERKVHKTSSIASSVQREDVPSDEIETRERKVCKPSSRASSVQREDVPTEEIVTHERKVHKPSSRAGSVQCEDVPSEEIVTHERKVHKPSSRASSVQCEDVPSEEIVTHERKVHKPSSRAGSIQHDDVPSDEIETCERKVCKPSSRASSVQREDVPPDGTESYERKVRKPSSRASSVQREDVPSDGTESGERKVRKPSSRASSVQREDVPSDGTESGERKVRKPSSRVSSVQREDVPSDGTESGERKVRKPSSRASSVQREDVPSDGTESGERKVRKPSSRASSVQREDVPPDGTESDERKVRKPSSRASSVQREDVPPDGTESGERKARKPSSRANSVQHEDVPVDEIESCERKVRKPSSRASSVQREDVPSDGTESGERKVRKPSSRASSVQREDVPSDGTESGERKVRKPSSRANSVQHEDVPVDEIESCERKVRKPSSRASSVQHEDVPVDEIESCERKVRKASSGASSVQREDVPTDESSRRKIHKPGSRSGSGQCEYVPIGGTDDNERKVCNSSSSGCSDQQQVVPSSETESLERSLPKPKRREGSVQGDCLEAIEEEESYNSEVDKIDSGINSVQNAHIPSEEADCRKCKIDDCKKSGSVTCIDVTEADSLDRPNSRASSVDYRDVTSANDFAFNENRRPRASSVNSEASTVIREESPRLVRCKEKCGTRSRHSSASSKSSSVQGDEGMDVEKVKIYSTRSRKGSIPLDIVYEGPKDIIDHTPVSATHDADIPIQTDDKERKIEAKCRAVSGFILEDQGISGLSSQTNEMFTSNVTGQLCRKARSESGYVVGPVTRNKRFTRSTVGISTKTTTTDVGSVTDNSASTKMSLRSGQDRMRRSLGILGSVHGDGSFSERSSGSSVQWKGKADSTSRGDSLSTQQVIEEYATNRRLTRHQRSMLERSLELAKPSLSLLTRHRKLPSLAETSGDEEDKPGEEDESSSQISSVGTHLSHPRSCPTFHERTSPISQVSTIHLPSSEIPLRKAGTQTRCSQKTLSRRNDSTPTDFPISVMSDASTPYASSATSALSQRGASPLSTQSEDVTLERMRRKSFKRAQIALRSTSEHGSVSGVPSGRESVANSPGDSDSNVSSNVGSSHTSLTSTGSHITRSVAMRLGRGCTSEEVRRSPRLARLQDEDLHSALPSTSFHFSPPTLVLGSVRKEESSSGTPASPVPAFVFSPPQKQQLLPKPHRQNAPSQQTRAHTMALRGLHTITEESTPPSTPTNTSAPQSSERDTTPIAVKKSKKFKPTPSSKTPHRSSRRHLMTPLTNKEQQELAERERSSRRSVYGEPHHHYTVSKHRKLFKIRRSRRSNL